MLEGGGGAESGRTRLILVLAAMMVSTCGDSPGPSEGCDGSDFDLQRVCSISYDGAGGPYECAGIERCTADGWSSCEAPAEVCNAIDDDCDGDVDEGFVDSEGGYTSDENCGACGVDCTLLAAGSFTGVCNGAATPPVCAMSCSADNCYDANNDPADGCECCDPQLTDTPDVGGTDANCDGIDGEILNAIFVSKAGDDDHTGEGPLAAKRTIQAGIDAAVAQSKDYVLVATGIYSETVTLAPGVGVYGGYSTEFAVRSSAVFESVIVAPASGGTPGLVNGVGLSGAAAATTFDGFRIVGRHETESGSSSYAVYLRDCDHTVALTNNLIIGGVGGSGSLGDDGDDGADGSPGQDGIAAKDVEEAGGSSWDACDSLTDASTGGSGATHTCGETSTDGGSGGNRDCPEFASGETVAPDIDEAGSSGSGGAAGGSAGWDVFQQPYSCAGYTIFGPTAAAKGEDGASGSDGDGGNGCSDSDGAVSSGLWTPNTATAGAPGDHGAGGGGGGAGAGAYLHASCGGSVPPEGCAASSAWGNHNIGGTGGGGGAGACGGTGGLPGMGGGASFAAFVVFDSAPTSVPIIADNRIELGYGGAGGPGGSAGLAGRGGGGGAAGASGSDFESFGCSYPSFAGGAGGEGGNGGHGGGGGGGCGGPAYGIFADGQASQDLSAWLGDNTFVSSGEHGGAEGSGGLSQGNPGASGLPGVTSSTNF